MKYIISSNQYKLLMEQEEDVLELPFEVFNNDWNLLQKFLERRGFPPYKIWGNLDLSNSNVTDLGNLISVSGDLNLRNTPIKNLGNLTSVEGSLNLLNTKIKSLGNLTYVGGHLSLRNTPIESLGNLTYVGGNLILYNTPISKTMSKEEIRQIVNVKYEIYL